MLGKRPRPPMKRTASMSVIGSGCANDDPRRSDSTDSPQKVIAGGVCYESRAVVCGHMPSHGMDFVGPQANPPWQAPGPAASRLGDGSQAFTPIGPPGSSLGCSVPSTPEPAHFLEACHLCKRRLGDGQDIYMYRGDTAFCSVECRQQQISMDERKEKSSVTGMKKVSASSANHHDNSSNFQARPGTVAAA